MRRVAVLVLVLAAIQFAGCSTGVVIKSLRADTGKEPIWLIYNDGEARGDALFYCVPPSAESSMPKCVKAQMVDIRSMQPVVIEPRKEEGAKK